MPGSSNLLAPGIEDLPRPERCLNSRIARCRPLARTCHNKVNSSECKFFGCRSLVTLGPPANGSSGKIANSLNCEIASAQPVWNRRLSACPPSTCPDLPRLAQHPIQLHCWGPPACVDVPRLACFSCETARTAPICPKTLLGVRAQLTSCNKNMLSCFFLAPPHGRLM